MNGLHPLGRHYVLRMCLLPEGIYLCPFIMCAIRVDNHQCIPCVGHTIVGFRLPMDVMQSWQTALAVSTAHTAVLHSLQVCPRCYGMIPLKESLFLSYRHGDFVGHRRHCTSLLLNMRMMRQLSMEDWRQVTSKERHYAVLPL